MTTADRQLGRDASPLNPVDLSGAFGTPNRAAGLPNLRTPPPPPAAAPAPVAQPPTPPPAPTSPPTPPSLPATSEQPQKTAAPATKTRRKATSRKAKPPATIVVYLASSLRTRLRAHREATGRSHTNVILDALNATHQRLTDLVAAATSQPAPAMNGLFEVQPGRHVHDEDQVQVSIRPTTHNLDVIDSLAAQHTAGNRSALVAIALDVYLPPYLG